ncbi:hypothetical protein TNCV_4555391 [Trichonephila clavipes]|nr:hypothetical protein TNCV_4555391 [Trichonephila clavipes]
MVTLYESRLSHSNKRRLIFSIAQLMGMTIRNGFVSVHKSSQRYFMIVAGLCCNGQLKIKKSQVKPKLIPSTILTNILKLIFDEEIPVLCEKNIDKVDLHMDKASNHMSKLTAAYLAMKESEAGIK